MKRLVIFVDSLKRDGAERVSVNLAKYMKSSGIETYLVTEWISENEYEVPEGVKRISLNAKGNKYLKYLFNIIKLRKVLKNISPDTLLIMDLPGCLLGIPASRNLKLKVVVSERNDPTHFPGKQVVAKISRFLMAKADGFVFQTKDAKKFYEVLVKGKGVIIPNPIFIDNLPMPYNGMRSKTIVTAGRLTEQKNHALLIDSFSMIHSEIPEYELIIYGEGHLLNNLRSQCLSLGIDEFVKFPGNKRDLLEKINDAALFVLSSNFEGMPNALLEAMALGLPVISTDCPCGGPRAVIQQNVNGILVPVGDRNALANEIVNLIGDSEKANYISTNAKKIREELNHNVICKKWKDYLENIC